MIKMRDILLNLTCKLEDPDGPAGTKASPAGGLYKAAAQSAGSWASWAQSGCKQQSGSSKSRFLKRRYKNG